MNIETLLSILRQNVLFKSVNKKMDESSREKLMECIKAAAIAENVEDKFCDCCAEAGLVNFNSLGADGEVKLSSSDAEKFANELAKAVKRSS